MYAHWNIDDRHRWEAFAESTCAGLAQSWAYGQAMQALGVPCLRVVVTQEPSIKSAWLGAAQFIAQRLPWFVRLTFCQGGPLWAEGVAVPVQQQAVDLMRRTLPLSRPRMALFSPAPAVGLGPGSSQGSAGDRMAASADDHALSHRTRVATGRSTVLLDLTRPEPERRAALEQRWRNRLNAAERSALKLRVCGSKHHDFDWLVQAEAAQRQERRYLTLPSGFVTAYQESHRKPSQALLTIAADMQHRPCAGMMFLVHGRTATYHLGWADDSGREHSAHNLLLWRACSLLAERGVERLDLAGVNTVSSPGLARFKLGTGGQVVTGAGTYW